MELGDKSSLGYTMGYKEGDPMEYNVPIYSCSRDDPPQRDDDPDGRELIPIRDM